MSACDPLMQAERRFKARCLNQSRWDLFPCRGPVVPCRTLSLVSATCNRTVKPWFVRPAAAGRHQYPKVAKDLPNRARLVPTTALGVVRAEALFHPGPPRPNYQSRGWSPGEYQQSGGPRTATGMCDPQQDSQGELMNSLHDVFRP